MPSQSIDENGDPLSTARREAGILMHVHPVSPRNLKLQQASSVENRMDNLLKAQS
jgi:hypothetical protein